MGDSIDELKCEVGQLLVRVDECLKEGELGIDVLCNTLLKQVTSAEYLGYFI